MSVSELSRSRPAPEPAHKPGLLTAMGSRITKVRSSLGRLAAVVFTRALLVFVIGFAAGMAWQSYGNNLRKTVAGWSPRLAWVAPAAASDGASRDRLKAASAALTAVRQSVDKLATEVDKLQDVSTSEQRSGSRRENKRR